jgi:hypothetical protein
MVVCDIDILFCWRYSDTSLNDLNKCIVLSCVIIRYLFCIISSICKDKLRIYLNILINTPEPGAIIVTLP